MMACEINSSTVLRLQQLSRLNQQLPTELWPPCLTCLLTQKRLLIFGTEYFYFA